MSFIRGGWRNTVTVLWKHGCSRLPLQTRLRITSEILAGKHTYIAIGYFSKCIRNSWTDRLRGGALSNLPWLRGKTKNKCQGMIKAWKVVLDLEWAWRTTVRDLALWKETTVLHMISYFPILRVYQGCFQCLWENSQQAEEQVPLLWFEEKQCHWQRKAMWKSLGWLNLLELCQPDSEKNWGSEMTMGGTGV